MGKAAKESDCGVVITTAAVVQAIIVSIDQTTSAGVQT
jgi:hypothetical protein